MVIDTVQVELDTPPRIGESAAPAEYLPMCEIPTDDPDAALAFCRRLRAALAAPALGTETPAARELFLELSLVIPVFNEQENLQALRARLTTVLGELGVTYEIVFVDDGSSDATPQLLREFVAADSRIGIVSLARNFGQQAAISAGLDYASGRAVVVMDADLQDPPEMLGDLVARWREGYDVVYAVRDTRSEGALQCLAYRAFYRLLHRIANVDIPIDAGDFCLMDRRAVDVIRGFPERNRFLRGLRGWAGFRQAGIPYDRPARHAGKPKYTLRRLLLLALDGLVSFSYVPLRVSSIAGSLIALASLAMGVFYAVKRLTTGMGPAGFASIMVALFFFSGIQLLTIGVMGEYVGRIFDEVKRRPTYVVREVISGSERCAS